MKSAEKKRKMQENCSYRLQMVLQQHTAMEKNCRIKKFFFSVVAVHFFVSLSFFVRLYFMRCYLVACFGVSCNFIQMCLSKNAYYFFVLFFFSSLSLPLLVCLHLKFSLYSCIWLTTDPKFRI